METKELSRTQQKRQRTTRRNKIVQIIDIPAKELHDGVTGEVVGVIPAQRKKIYHDKVRHTNYKQYWLYMDSLRAKPEAPKAEQTQPAVATAPKKPSFFKRLFNRKAS